MVVNLIEFFNDLLQNESYKYIKEMLKELIKRINIQLISI